MQLCDALDFLSGLDPPIAHGGVTADCILIDTDDALKLTNFDRARNEEDRSGDIAAVGKLIKSMGRFYANRYRSVIEKCEGEYEYDSFGDSNRIVYTGPPDTETLFSIGETRHVKDGRRDMHF
jgi:hypothetical protein